MTVTVSANRGDRSDRIDDPGSLEDAVAAGATQAWLEQLGVEVVHLGLVDTSGTLRSKRLSAAAAARAMEKGWSFIDAIQWWDPGDRTWRVGGSVQQPASVDLSSAHTYPFEPDAVGFLADFDGVLGELSPRLVLARTIERADRSGIIAHVGWEFECIVFEGRPHPNDPSSRLIPAMDSNRCWSALTMAAEADTLRALTELLGSAGIEVDHVCAELGPGCLELALRPAPAMQSADAALLGKLFTKAFFQRRGQTATFMAQVAGNYPGLGGHPSLSLRSTLDGEPLLEDHGGLSKLAHSGIAGVVTLLPELLVMALPSPNSYRRLAPGNWAPSHANWGPGNYSCALRAVTGEPEDTRLELRIPGADTTPHLCLAMLLGALTWGIEQGLPPIGPVIAPEDGRLQPGGRTLPRDLTEAAERFGASTVARDLFGGSFVDHFTASRLAEADACRQFVSSEEQARYLHSA